MYVYAHLYTCIYCVWMTPTDLLPGVGLIEDGKPLFINDPRHRVWSQTGIPGPGNAIQSVQETSCREALISSHYEDVCPSKQPLCILKPCFPGHGQTSLIDGK